MDPRIRIRIHTKISWICNTAEHLPFLSLSLYSLCVADTGEDRRGKKGEPLPTFSFYGQIFFCLERCVDTLEGQVEEERRCAAQCRGVLVHNLHGTCPQHVSRVAATWLLVHGLLTPARASWNRWCKGCFCHARPKRGQRIEDRPISASCPGVGITCTWKEAAKGNLTNAGPCGSCVDPAFLLNKIPELESWE